MKGRQILLARHGSTGEAFRSRFVGSTDVPLAPEGALESRALADRIIAGFRPAFCWCSPLQRARQTAAIVAEALGIEIIHKEGLREIDFGRWEGMSFAEIAESDPELVADWTANPNNFRFPDGERIADFRNRVASAARHLAEAEGSILVVAHGGVIRTMLCRLLGLSMESYLAFDVQPARLAIVTLFDERGVLGGFNL